MRKKLICNVFNILFLALLSLSVIAIMPYALAQQTNLEADIAKASKRLEQNTDITEEKKKQAISELEEAQDLLTKAKEQRNLADAYEEQAASASQQVIAIGQSNQQLRNKPVDVDTGQPIKELENQLLLDVSEQNSRLADITQKQTEQTNLSLRANEIARQLSAARADKTTIEDSLAKQSTEKLGSSDDTNYLKKQANIAKLTATIDSLEREVATIPERQSLVDAELVQLRLQSKYHQRKISQLRAFVIASREDRVEEIVKQASDDLEELKQNRLLSTIARENVALANLLKSLQNSSSLSEENASTLRTQLSDVQQSSETVERVLATGRVTDELGELLRRLRAALPRESVIQVRKTKVEEDAIRHQLNVILWQERLRNLADTPSSAEQLLIESSSDDKVRSSQEGNSVVSRFTQLELEKSQELVNFRRDLLSDLIEVSNSKSDRIIAEKLVINRLLSASSELRELLERRLIWLPSNSGKAGNLGNNLQYSLEWILLPSAWGDLINDLYQGALAAPVLPLLLFAFASLILALRRIIKRTLWSLVDRVGKVNQDTFFTTPLALFLTFVLALPLPFFLFAIAALIFRGAEASSFSSAIATGLTSASTISLILLFFRSMSRNNGVFDEHFGWSVTARNKLRATLTWFVWLQSIAAFVFASAIASGDTELRYGSAIIAFIAGSIGIAIFSYQFFQPKNGVATSIVGDTSASPLTLIAFPIVVLAPLVIGLLPLFGFFDTAVELQSKLFSSGTLLVFAAVVYGIMLRIFLVAFRRYIVKKEHTEAIEAEKARNEPISESSGEESLPETESKSIDEKDVMRQSKAIMLWITGLLFLAGLWFVWKPLLPALGIVDDIVLWQEVRIVDGVELSSGVTLWNIILSLGLVIGGFVAAKNIRGVMEIGFFERFEMDTGARYATITILGYVLVGTGIVVGLSQLGIDWSKLQWIIAALGVGLGFGLQEIVANFVSGLIILFERPIRVGDFVTIGNLSGTVSNIKIRATTVTDFDNREVLLPNKSIITENVTNWTLKDSVTRIVVKIGVAYGSDIVKVRELLMQVIEEQNDVLELPAPQVFFLEHGDSSLNFEVRVFVGRPAERLPMTHAINLGINQILEAHDIAIPFPQRDLHIVSGQLPEGS